MSNTFVSTNSSRLGEATGALRDHSIDVLTDDRTLGYLVDEMVPDLVVRPTSSQATSDVMTVASEYGLSVVPIGGMTRTNVGNPPQSYDIAIDLTALNQVVSHNPADLTATVQAGIPVSRFQQILAEHGQFLAIDPPLPDRATIGGTLAVGWGGPMTWQYWNPRDVVIGMKVVQADGPITKSGGQVVKNVSGYDMARMHIGALGTLGIIAEVSFKLTPLPALQSTIIAKFDADQDCLDAALDVFQSNLVPLAITTLHGEAAQKLLPGDTANGPILAIRIGGRAKAVQRQIDDMRALCKGPNSSNCEVINDSTAASLWRGVADFGWDSQTTPAVGIRASVLPSDIRRTLNAIFDTSHALQLKPSITTQTAHGTLQINWYDHDSESSTEQEQAAIAHTLRAVDGGGGTAIVEQVPLAIKATTDVWGDAGSSVDIMRNLKQQYDPNALLNPGRLVGGI
jgi:glycolate oxidase FAD binding subunit